MAIFVNNKKIKVSESLIPSILDERKITIYALPQDMLMEIFSNLSRQDLIAALGVSRNWRKAAIATAKKEEIKLLDKILTIISTQITVFDFLPQKELYTFLPLIQDAKSLSLENGLKARILQIRDRISEKLLCSEFEVIDSINKSSQDIIQGTFFSKTFLLAKIYKQVNELTHLTNNKTRDKCLYELAIELIQMNEFEKAKKLSLKIYELAVKNAVFISVVKGLADRGNPEEALLFMRRKFPDGIYHNEFKIDFINRTEGYYAICKALSKNNSIDAALGVLDQINSFEEKLEALSCIIEFFLISDNIDPNIKISELIIKIKNNFLNFQYFISISNENPCENQSISSPINDSLSIFVFRNEIFKKTNNFLNFNEVKLLINVINKCLFRISHKLLLTTDIQNVDLAKKVLEFSFCFDLTAQCWIIFGNISKYFINLGDFSGLVNLSEMVFMKNINKISSAFGKCQWSSEEYNLSQLCQILINNKRNSDARKLLQFIQSQLIKDKVINLLKTAE